MLSAILNISGGGGLFSLLGFAGGGQVPGSGSGDTVPAMLTPGEFVVKKGVVNKIFGEEQLQLWFAVFPEAFRVFCVKNGEVASLGLTVRVGKNVLYHFCPADNLAYRQYSPSVLLTKGLYEFSQQEGVTILDLGISVDAAGQPKNSLARFRRNLGAQECEKWQFERKIGISTKM